MEPLKSNRTVWFSDIARVLRGLRDVRCMLVGPVPRVRLTDERDDLGGTRGYLFPSEFLAAENIWIFRAALNG